VTGFIGPLALAAVTAATGSLRAGMAVVLVLLGAGALLLSGVRPDRTAARPEGVGQLP
jgi:UMF1 family MFS transporter